MKICVLGAGALGCAIGGTLSKAGHEVWLITRNQTHVAAMQKNGLRMRMNAHEHAVPLFVPVHAVAQCIDVSLASDAVELIIVLVKSSQTEEAIQSALPLLSENTVVLSLQNGLGHEEILAQAVGRARVMAGKTYVGGILEAPGCVAGGVAGKETILGELDGTLSARARHITDTFNKAGLLTVLSDRILGVMWDKLMVNVATGALSGITRLNYGRLYQVPELEACALAAVEETMRVARALKVPISMHDAHEPWRKAGAGLPPEFKASMLQTLENNARTEIDFINGAVVRAGAQLGIATPVNATLLACIKGIEKNILN